MKISFHPFMVHQLNVDDVIAFERVLGVLEQVQDEYGACDTLSSPNTGEVIEISEIPRVRGVLSFLMENRVIEINVGR